MLEETASLFCYEQVRVRESASPGSPIRESASPGPPVLVHKSASPGPPVCSPGPPVRESGSAFYPHPKCRYSCIECSSVPYRNNLIADLHARNVRGKLQVHIIHLLKYAKY